MIIEILRPPFLPKGIVLNSPSMIIWHVYTTFVAESRFIKAVPFIPNSRLFVRNTLRLIVLLLMVIVLLLLLILLFLHLMLLSKIVIPSIHQRLKTLSLRRSMYIPLFCVPPSFVLQLLGFHSAKAVVPTNIVVFFFIPLL